MQNSHRYREAPSDVMEPLKQARSEDSPKKAACQEVAKAKSVSEIGAALNNLTEAYYRDVLNQAKASFACALIASAIGAGFFFVAAHSAMKLPAVQPDANSQVKPNTADTQAKLAQNAPDISLIAGALVEVIAGVNFYLYARASRQFSSFHICLERANRFLLVNMLCESLSAEEDRALMSKELIKTMLQAPMLTTAEVTGIVQRVESHAKDKEEKAVKAETRKEKVIQEEESSSKK